MEAGGNYEQFLQTLRAPDGLRVISRPLRGASLVIAEIQGPAGFGPTDPIAHDHAYVLQLRLMDCARCSYFLNGDPLHVEDRRAGALQFHDLRAAPSADIQDPFHVLHLYLPHQDLSALAEETSGHSLRELRVQPGDAYRDEIAGNLLLALRPALARPQETSALLVEHITQSLCVHLVQRYGGLGPARERQRGGLAAWQAQRARDLIETHLNGDISLARLAAECGLSIRHFTRAFAQTFGMPAHRYLTGRRIARALELLKVRTLSIGEIALECGFVDQSHLTRVFASHTGSSPGQWRRTQGGVY